MIYVGTKSFPSIISSNEDFVKKLNQYQPTVGINYLPKKHLGMMSQFLFPWNKYYKEIIEFINPQLTGQLLIAHPQKSFRSAKP